MHISDRFDVLDARHATALHESGHVLARLAKGLRTPSMNITGEGAAEGADAVGYTEGTGGRIDGIDTAVIAMAGPCVEGLMLQHLHGWDDARVHAHILERLGESRQALADAEEYGDDVEWYRDDYTAAGQYAEIGPALAMPLLVCHWGAVEALADAALSSATGSIDWETIKATVGIESDDYDGHIWATVDAAVHRRWMDFYNSAA